MGNSEVGHLNIGAGRVVMQELPRIGDAIAGGEIAKAPALTELIKNLKASGGTCHLIGLVSPGGVHSHQDHAAALAKILSRGWRHDSGSRADRRPRYAAAIRPAMTSSACCAALPKSVPIATVFGRYYAMDRDKRWDRVSKAYAAIVEARWPAFPRCAGSRRRRLRQQEVRRVHSCLR